MPPALSRAIARINQGVFEPTPSEFGCQECPLLDVACDGMALVQEERLVEANLLADPGPES